MKLFKIVAATLVLWASFATTSYIIARHVASNEEQRQDDLINSIVGTKVIEITDAEVKKGGGTGFFVNTPSGNTFILTNNHVCGLANEAGVLMIDKTYYAQIIAHSPDHDLCLVSNPFNETGIDVAASSRDGQDVYVIGHPHLAPLALIKGEISGTMNVEILIGYNLPCKDKGEENIDLSNTLAPFFGMNSACIKTYEAQATTLNILPGNSGSPVVDHDGKVVGVAFAGREDGPGRGYIVPLSYIQKFLFGK